MKNCKAHLALHLGQNYNIDPDQETPSLETHNTLTDTIGNTPLIHLRKASALTGCTILGKAEFMNPGGFLGALKINIQERA